MEESYVIAIDFDGVLADYSKGWQGWNVFGEPIEGAAYATQQLAQMQCFLIIWTTRQDTPALRKWLAVAGIAYNTINSCRHNPPHTGPKPIFDLILDDRAWPRMGVQFTRKNWEQVVAAVLAVTKPKG